MHPLTVIVSNFTHPAVLPMAVINHDDGGGWVVFCDYRNTPRERAAVIAPLADDLEVEDFEVHVIDPPLGGCECGYHQWEPVTAGEVMVGARCERCGYMETIQPVPTPKVQRDLAS